MASKSCLFLSACFFVIVTVKAGCRVPKKVVNPSTYHVVDYAGPWYTQGTYDTLSNRDNVPVCGVANYHTIRCGPHCINSSVVEIHKRLTAPCTEEPVGEHVANLVKDDITGALSIHTINPDTGNIEGSAPCYMIAGKPAQYHVSYCCKELQSGAKAEALLYYTRSADPQPDLAMKMHAKTMQAKLGKQAKKVTFLVPSACSGEADI